MLEEQSRERDAAPLAAGDLRHVGVVGRTAQRLHGDVDIALHVPCVGRVDSILERGLLGADGLVIGVGLGPLGHDGVVLIEQRLDAGHALHDVGLDVLVGVERRLLRQIADGEAGRQACLAGEPVVEAGHDPQQGRLAGAVGSDDADLGTRVERQ